jgi:integrase
VISIGTVEEGKRYRIWVSGGTDDQGRRVRVSERFNGRKVDAMKRARAIASDLDTGRYVARGPQTFGAFVAAWWPSKQAAIAPTTAQGYSQMLGAYVLPALEHRPLQKIAGADVSAVVGRLAASGHLAMADHVYVLLRLIFNAALRQGAIGKSPMIGVERPRVPRREVGVVSPADWQRVRAHLAERAPWAVRPFTLLLTSGVRRSELCALQWRDVDLDRAVLHVRRSYHVIAGQPVVKEPKSARSRRAIALDSHSVALLRDQRADADRIAAMFGRRVADTDPVFGNAQGRPWAPDSLTGLWRRSAVALGLPSRLHSLRHSSATLMLAAGVPVQLVSARLGHATAGFTLSVYAGVLPGAQADAAEKLAALLNGHAATPALIR